MKPCAIKISGKKYASPFKAKSRHPEVDEFYEPDSKGRAWLTFSQKVNVQRSYYSFTQLNLIGEVGGYVGLFLGANFLQFSDLLSLLIIRCSIIELA